MAVELETASRAEHPHTVLIVEDEVLTRIVLAQHLRDCGYRVLEAGNAAEAITVLEFDYMSSTFCSPTSTCPAT